MENMHEGNEGELRPTTVRVDSGWKMVTNEAAVEIVGIATQFSIILYDPSTHLVAAGRFSLAEDLEAMLNAVCPKYFDNVPELEVVVGGLSPASSRREDARFADDQRKEFLSLLEQRRIVPSIAYFLEVGAHSTVISVEPATGVFSFRDELS